MAGPGRVPMEVWFEFASPYAYMAVMRIERVIAGTPIELEWKPFILGPIFARRPDNPTPTQSPSPAVAAYRRRDVERTCLLDGIPLSWPSTYPRPSLLGARVALIAAAEGWCAPFAKALYSASFRDDRDIAAAPVVAEVLESLGKPAAEVIARASAPANKARLAEQVEAAVAKGIFGAPSFFVRGELFWGNDRLEQAVRWAVDRPAA